MNVLKCVFAAGMLALCACSSPDGSGGDSSAGASDTRASGAVIDASRMGVVLPLGGKSADCVAGAEILSGMQIAASEINAAGGVGGKPLRLEIRDSAQEEFAFSETLASMSDSGIKLFHVGLDDAIVAQYKVFGRLSDCFFNLMTTYPPATTGTDNATRIFVNGAQEGDLLTEQIEVVDRKQCYVVMNEDTLCGRSNSAYFCFNLNKGTAKAYADAFKRGEKNFGIFSGQIIRLKPRFVFYIGDGTELGDFAKSVRDSGYDGVLLATCGLLPVDAAKPMPGLRFGKLRTAYECGKVANDTSKKFVAAYEKKFGAKPSWLAAYGYDAVMLAARAASEPGVTSGSMRKFFSNKTFEGAMGKLKFDSSADLLSELEIVELK